MDAVKKTTLDVEGIVARHQVAVWRYLRWLGCTPNEAEELAQDVFVRLLGGGFVASSEASTWRYLRGAARFAFLQLRGRQSRRVEVGWTDAVDAWCGEQQRGGDGGSAWLAALDHCSSAVDGRARAVLDGFYVEGRSRVEIAERLGMKENGVKTLLQRLRARLRECIQREMNG